ncbi:MAG TPA: hypothetical protein P5277_02805 [Candidatus Paceibacterota bacterium]|nr:hypothetical protein [Candidatus Paceibacterota bacterium]
MQTLLKKDSKKAQLKIQQMSIMLIFIFLFFIFVFLLFSMYETNKLRQTAVDIEKERIAGMTIKLASTPEFNFGKQANSIDGDKVMMFKSKKGYSNLLGVNGVIITKIPEKSNPVECTTSNYPECDVIKIFTKKDIPTNSQSSIFVALCRKQTSNGASYDRCELARMQVEVNISEKLK